MLGCTCTIHLGIQWPKIRCSRAYAQHQHGMLHSLCPTFPNYIFMCSKALCSTQMKMLMCSRASCSTQNISSITCFRVHAQHKHFINHVLQGPHPTQNIYTYISSTIGLHPIYKTNHHFYMQWGL